MTELVTCKGGCHCGRVRFEAYTRPDPEVQSCNCSICAKTGYLHLIVPQSRFRLLTPWEALSTYTFNTGIARHYFCKTCGIKSFYVPRSNPDGYSVNVRCLDPGALPSCRITEFDGQNWEKHGQELADLSRDA